MTEPEEYPDIPCEPPAKGEVGDIWYCPSCARKFYYVMVNLSPETDEEDMAEAWYTNEVR